MIKSKEELNAYLEADRIALGKEEQRKPRLLLDTIWSYQILLRKCEYYENCRKDIMGRIYGKFLKFRFVRFSQKLGFSVPFNVCDMGLSIAHYGSLVISAEAMIGKNCRIHENVTIGVDGNSYWGDQKGQAPIIGDNVFIATGAKVIGNIRIADNVAIGANAVVVNDILEPNTTWGGVPAREISKKGSKEYILRKES